MSVALELFNSKPVKNRVKSQLKLIQKNKIESVNVLQSLVESVKDKYSVIRASSQEVCIKVEKKKNADIIEEDIKSTLQTILNSSEFDLNFLFRFIRINNEFIIRVKRHNG